MDRPVILLTGAANGIGAALAKAIADHYTLILVDKDIAGLTAVSDSLPKADIFLYPFDFKGATVDDYQTLMGHIDTNLNRLDGLVHCAAALGQLAPIAHQQPVQWAETLHVNLTASYLLTQAALPLIQQQSRGLVIFTSDDRKDNAYWSAYGISKAAIETLSKQLQAEFSNNEQLQISCIHPETARTQLNSRAFPGLDAEQFADASTVLTPYLQALNHLS